jgi:pyruvate/2-oxoglutarate dehydrogenase complex dihydrolipoamide acyltransferase (E2) component
MAAGASLSIAAYAGSTGIGRERAKVAMADFHEILIPSGVTPARPLTAQEGRRLAETVRVLAADRGRLVARIATLEHGLDDVTGSIAKVQKAAEEAAKPPEPAQAAAAPEKPAEEPAENDVTSSIPSTATTQSEPEADDATPAKPQFALDLGIAPTIDQLRTAWTIALRRHGTLLQGLNPAVHQSTRPGRAIFHLLAGPLPSAAAAAKICQSMTAAGAICSPAMFDGQRLALR